jgi:alkyl sulfatase BDS1-like metallo-beta-lactamase superfamily hydrolase
MDPRSTQPPLDRARSTSFSSGFTRAWPLGLLAGLCLVTAGCGTPGRSASTASAPAVGPVHPAVQRAQAEVAHQLRHADASDFADAKRGFIAAPSGQVRNEAGQVIWDHDAFAFQQAESAPDSVNPSLWRQAKLNNIHGLFQVSEGIYQLRGFDLSNMTLIEGEQGWIVVDPLTSRETAARALAFAREHLGERPVSAIIFTHSHVDHFGGVLGVASAEEIAARGIRVIAPEGFMEEATSENMLAGTTMGRRAAYMYGQHLAHAPRGHVDTGLGKGCLRQRRHRGAHRDRGTHRRGTRDRRRALRVPVHAGLGGPAEFTFYLPDLKAFCGAEIVSHTLHNLYTLRGAKVRDALKWSGYIDEAIHLFGDAQVYFGSHHWPLWGEARITDFLQKQRDTYRYIHDQTLRLAALGRTPQQIADELELPASLAREFANRGYYGTVRHNAKAVYQFYFGWYDANPSRLNPLAPAEAAPRYVEFMGGGAAVLAKAQASFDKGDLPLGRRGADPPGVRRAGQWRGARAAGARLRPARLPGGIGAVARRLPERRVGAATWRAAGGGRCGRGAGAAAQHAHRALPRHARSCPQPPSTSCPADWRSLVRTPRWCSARHLGGALPRSGGGKSSPSTALNGMKFITAYLPESSRARCRRARRRRR